MSQTQLAKAVGVSGRTIGRLETFSEDIGFDVIASARDVLEKCGLTFLSDNGGGEWCLTFDDNLAPFPLPGAETNGLFNRAPGSVLRAARASIPASQEELAAKAGVAHTTIRLLERSDTSVSASRAFRYQNFFKQTDVEIVQPEGNYGWQIRIKT